MDEHKIIQIITTADGSHSLLNTELNETYHSVHGAVQESNHVFIKNGLDFFCNRSAINPVRIFEMGFGTGLNALLTIYRASEIRRQIHYTTLETNPVPEAVWGQLNYTHSPESRKIFETLHEADWSKDISVSKDFTLLKINASLREFELHPLEFDLIYYDAFAPSKQPELWEFSILKKVTDAIHANGILVTYCAKGQVKRDLKAMGMHIETLPGPPGKKEMVRATKNL